MKSEHADFGKSPSEQKVERDALRAMWAGAVTYDGPDKIIILCLIIGFGALFVWLLMFEGDQAFYPYLTFLALLTLVFVGILRAVGALRTSVVTLGGAAAVFGGLFLLTGKFQDQSEKIGILTCSDAACATLKQYFHFIEKRNFKEAFSLLTESWKQRQLTQNGQDYFERFPSFFNTTVSYKDWSFLLRE